MNDAQRKIVTPCVQHDGGITKQGYGWVTVNGRPRGERTMIDDCPECGGDGMDDDVTPCPWCDGEGYEWWLP